MFGRIWFVHLADVHLEDTATFGRRRPSGTTVYRVKPPGTFCWMADNLVPMSIPKSVDEQEYP
jgi:hypothetical protein